MRFPHCKLRGLRAALVAAVLAAAGCGPRGDSVGPGNRIAPDGEIALSTRIAAISASTGPLRLQVDASYERTNGPLASLSTQSFPATSGSTQQVPFSVDLTTCLSDRTHRGAAPGAGGNAVCLVHLAVTLLTGDRVLDTQSLGPIPVSPGSAVNLGQLITLYEVARVEVVPSTGSAPPAGTAARLEMGQSLPLTALVLDAGGQTVPGRVAHWTSDAPAVARVDSITGVVTPVAVGVVRVRASAGGREGTLDVNVVPAPAPIAVRGSGGTGSGHVRSSPAGLDCQITAGVASGACTFNFPGDAAVTLTATPDSGSAFGAWAGDCAPAGALVTCQLTPSTARTVTASFTKTVFVLSVSGSGIGGGRLSTPAPGIDCQVRAGVTSGTCAAPFSAQTVALTVTPDSASVLANWTGDCATQSPAVLTCPVAMTQTRSVGVVFGRRQVTVTLGLTGAAGQVTLGGTPACTLAAGVAGVTCPVRVDAYGLVTLLARPAASSFTKLWGGPCTTVPVDQPCTFRPAGDVTVPVVFLPAPVGISVRPAGSATGSGSVTIPELDHVCQLTGSSFGPAGQCDGAAAVGSTLTLTAQAAAGSSFVGWGGACAGQTGPTCTLPISAAVTAIADFELVAGPAGARGVSTAVTAARVPGRAASAAARP